MKTIPEFNFKYEIMASEPMIDYLKSLLNDNIKAVDDNLQKLAEIIMIKIYQQKQKEKQVKLQEARELLKDELTNLNNKIEKLEKELSEDDD